MKAWKKVVIFLVILMALAVVPVMVQAGNGANRGTKVPYDQKLEIDCPAGNGEWVHFTGFENRFEHITHDGNGGRHVKLHINLINTTGTGEETGALYRLVDSGNSYFLYFPPDEQGEAHRHVATLVLTRHVFSKDQAVKLLIHETRRYTMNVNGEVIVDFIKHDVTCK